MISQIWKWLSRHIKFYLHLWSKTTFLSKTTSYYLLHCPSFSNEILILFSKLPSIDENILCKGDSDISQVLPFGEHLLNDVKNTFILNEKNWYIMCSLILVFVKNYFVHSFHLFVYFLYLIVLPLDYFVKWFILLC